MKQPCIDCGKVTDGTRCRGCANDRARQRRERAARRGTVGYTGDYQRRSRAVRAAATICWLCGDGPRDDDPWQADHILPVAEYGGVGPLAPAHRSCNIARANRLRANNPTDPAFDRLTAGHGGPPTNTRRRRRSTHGDR